ncbi:MAG: hypothetical protein CM1200mP22_30910 [Dehalococcoidia bacterium]|nr:MAG: hypothetical protein CM1200mP22_30910 [Dehalococcoidia bacterium]
MTRYLFFLCRGTLRKLKIRSDYISSLLVPLMEFDMILQQLIIRFHSIIYSRW